MQAIVNVVRDFLAWLGERDCPETGESLPGGRLRDDVPAYHPLVERCRRC